MKRVVPDETASGVGKTVATLAIRRPLDTDAHVHAKGDIFESYFDTQ